MGKFLSFTIFGLSLLIFLNGCGDLQVGKIQVDQNQKNPEDTDKKLPQTDADDLEIGFRNLNIDLEVNEFQPVVKVAIIVDNSDSMLDEQQNLADGVQGMIENLRQERLNLDFYIYSTTSESNNQSLKPVSTQRTLYQYLNDEGELITTEDSTAFDEQTPLTRFIRWSLNPSLGKPLEMKIRKDMSDSEFEAAAQMISDTITTIGTNGSNSEKGLCSFGRLLAEPEVARRVFRQGDFSAFIIISDSNDSSSDSNCYFQKEQDFGPANEHTRALKTDNRDEPGLYEWRYRIRYRKNYHDRIQLRYKTCIVDGQLRDCDDAPWRYHSPWASPSQVGEPPFSTPFVGCTTEALDWLENDQGQEVAEGICEYRYRQTNRYPLFRDRDLIYGDIDICTQSFEYDGQTYQDLDDYFRQNVSVIDDTYETLNCRDTVQEDGNAGGRYIPPYGQTSPETEISLREYLDDSASTLAEAITNKATQLFGDDGFFVASIIDEEDIPVIPGQGEPVCFGPPEQQGTDYLDFILSLESQGTAFPICSVDYSPSLSLVEIFIEQIVNDTYVISDLGENEEIEEVFILRGSEEIEVSEGDQFEIVGNSLRFEEGVLQPTDQLKVTIRFEN